MRFILATFVFYSTSFSLVAAFVRPSASPGTVRRLLKGTLDNTTKNILGPLRLKSDDDDGEDVFSEAIGGGMVSALARLDDKWKLATQADGRKNVGTWNALDLKEDGDTSPEIVYLLEPTAGVPSCVIFFLGGAVLGQFPHISYSTFLQRVAVKMNASVIAIPYEVGLDHFSIAQQAVGRIKKAVIECEDSRGYPPEMPKYALGHSLGAKLHSIGIAATGIGEELSGVGFVSYNNFGFAETITMARSFAKELQVNGPGFGAQSFDTLFDLASGVVSAVGLEFTPSPLDMDRIVQTKFDGDVLKKTRMFQFEDDDLDSTQRFIECSEGDELSVSYLPGTHLTPVFLKLGLDDLPDETKDMASQVAGGFQNASFGNEETLDVLVEEVAAWMLGKSPNDRRPAAKQIGGTIEAEIEE